MSKRYINISYELLKKVSQRAAMSNRTIEDQLEYWVKVGMIVESLLDTADINLVLEGKASIVVEAE